MKKSYSAPEESYLVNFDEKKKPVVNKPIEDNKNV